MGYILYKSTLRQTFVCNSVLNYDKMVYTYWESDTSEEQTEQKKLGLCVRERGTGVTIQSDLEGILNQ